MVNGRVQSTNVRRILPSRINDGTNTIDVCCSGCQPIMGDIAVQNDGAATVTCSITCDYSTNANSISNLGGLSGIGNLGGTGLGGLNGLGSLLTAGLGGSLGGLGGGLGGLGGLGGFNTGLGGLGGLGNLGGLGGIGGLGLLGGGLRLFDDVDDFVSNITIT